MIVVDARYIGSHDAIIDKDEYNETRDNIEYIKADAQRYIDEYVDYALGKQQRYDSREVARIYQYSTLRYFHKELGRPGSGRCNGPAEPGGFVLILFRRRSRYRKERIKQCW